MSQTHKPTETIEVPAGTKAEIEAEAARLNLTTPAYIRYLMERRAPGADADRVDRHVDEVFGRFGKTMRDLSE